MLKVLAGSLSATFNIDGRHLERFEERREAVGRTLCDHLLLHDQIIIPTQDYLTAAGLVRVLGERTVLTLLAEDRLRFVRLPGMFCYVRGTGPDGQLATMRDPTGKLPNSAPIDRSVDMGLSTINGEYTDHNRLKKLLIDRSHELDLTTVVSATRKDAYADLSQTSLWKDSYRVDNQDLLALPGAKEMKVRMIAPNTDVTNNVIDACLALGLMNIELYLAKQFECVSSSTGSPIGDCISLKIPRLTSNHAVPERLWHFLNVAGVPDFSGPLLADRGEMAKFLKLTRHRDADAFRHWFHENENLSETDILKAYIDVLQQTPWIQRTGPRLLRMVLSLALGTIGLGLAVDAGVSLLDNFVVDNFHGKGTKFFIEDLRRILWPDSTPPLIIEMRVTARKPSLACPPLSASGDVLGPRQDEGPLRRSG